MCYLNLEESSAEVFNPQNALRMMVGYRGLQDGCLVHSLCFCTKCECTHIQPLLCTFNRLHDVGWVLQVSITLIFNFRKRSSVIDGSQLRDLSVGNVNPILSTPSKTFLRMLISYLEQYVHTKNGHSVLSLFCTNCQFCGYRMCSRAQVEKTSLQFWM